MKRIINLIAFAFIATLSANASSFYLRFANPATYDINIDGFYYQVNGTDFCLPFLGAGQHRLIISSRGSNYGRRRPMPVVHFNGALCIREYSDMFASLDGCNFRIDREIPHRVHNNYQRPYHYKYNSRFRRYEVCEGENDRHRNNDRDRRDDRDGRDDRDNRDREHGDNDHRGHR